LIAIPHVPNGSYVKSLFFQVCGCQTPFPKEQDNVTEVFRPTLSKASFPQVLSGNPFFYTGSPIKDFGDDKQNGCPIDPPEITGMGT
jgi:hypothetical protein